MSANITDRQGKRFHFNIPLKTSRIFSFEMKKRVISAIRHSTGLHQFFRQPGLCPVLSPSRLDHVRWWQSVSASSTISLAVLTALLPAQWAALRDVTPDQLLMLHNNNNKGCSWDLDGASEKNDVAPNSGSRNFNFFCEEKQIGYIFILWSKYLPRSVVLSVKIAVYSFLPAAGEFELFVVWRKDKKFVWK